MLKYKDKFSINVINIIKMYEYIDNINISYDFSSGSNNYSSLKQYLENIIMKELKKIIYGIKDTNFSLKQEITSNPRGKINFKNSMISIYNNHLEVEYNSFDHNSSLNQILKTLIINFYPKNKLWIQNEYLFSDVELITFNRTMIISYLNKNIPYNANTLKYKNIFKWFKLLLFIDGNNESLESIKLPFDYKEFEKFIASFYKKELFQYEVKSQTIFKWNNYGNFISNMRPDITISKDNEPLYIIDTKFYKNITANDYYNNEIHKNNNLYQMNAYLSNSSFKYGIILYASDSNQNSLNSFVNNTSNDQIIITSINLNDNFNIIKQNLFNLNFHYDPFTH